MTRRSMSRALGMLALVGSATRLLPAQQRSTYEELQTFSGVLSYVRANYVDSVAVSSLIQAAIEGVLHSLDPHSSFLRRSDMERLASWENGRLVTTGLYVEAQGGAIVVQAVLPESPAAKAGVLSGDRLLAMDDTSVSGLPVQRVQARLVGESGSRIRLTFERGSGPATETLALTLKRAAVPVRSTALVQMLDPITGYVALRDFKVAAGKDVHDAVQRLTRTGAKRLVLDLRENPGGVVDAAVDVASEFLPRGTLVFRSQGRKVDSNRSFLTERDGSFAAIPLIVLIDQGTASAAEALSACLQDHDRALIMGRTSFGKALEQMSLPLPSGDAVLLTFARIVSPSGRVIQRPYTGLAYEQYFSLAGDRATPDTGPPFHTDRGRPVRGGGGVVPDVHLPLPVSLPVWWSAAIDSGFDNAVADSVALTLPRDLAARRAWLSAPDQWRDNLLAPFLARVRQRFHVVAQTDTALDSRLARVLAARAAEVRWGQDALEEFLLRSSPDIQAAIAYFPRLPALLSPDVH
jgi:carboxyl-terminal processing protease